MLGIHRSGHLLEGRLGTATIRMGDTLILVSDPGFRDRFRDRADFLLVAELDGRVLEPVRLDGWRQGFLVPGGAGGLVDAEFYPGRWYTAGLAVGGALVVLLLGWWAVLRRRPPA